MAEIETLQSNDSSSSSQELQHCRVCNKLTPERCTVCGKVGYCCLEHEEEDRLEHRFECHALDSDDVGDRWDLRGEPVPSDRRTSQNRSQIHSRIETSEVADLDQDSPDDGDFQAPSEPSEIKLGGKRKGKKGKKGKKVRRKSKPARVEIKAFYFAAAADEPEIVQVSCSEQYGPFEDIFHRVHTHRLVEPEATFNTIPTYRGLFLVIRSSDDTARGLDLESNQCIFNLTSGLGRVWKGNVLVVKEMLPNSSRFCDIVLGDLDVLRTYFKLDGQAPLNTLTRHLTLSEDPNQPGLPPSVPGFPFPQPSATGSTSRKPFIDVLVFPATSPVPYLTPLSCSPLTGRPHRADYEGILGPDPIFNRVITYAGTFMVGCRPRFGYEGERLWNADDDEEGEEGQPKDINESVMCMTRRQGGWKRWPRVNIIALKLKSEYETVVESSKSSIGLSTPGGPNEPGRVPKDATIFDVAPLVRYFQLSGTMPESALAAALSRP